jgi:hypothetical protein
MIIVPAPPKSCGTRGFTSLKQCTELSYVIGIIKFSCVFLKNNVGVSCSPWEKRIHIIDF